MPTIEPITVMPLSTVSKIGSAHLVVGGQADQHQAAAAAQRAEGLLERPRRRGEDDRGVGAAERLDGLGRVLAAAR